VINTNLTYLFGNETGERVDTEKIFIPCGRLMCAFSTTTLVMSVRMEQYDTHQTDFRKKPYLGYLIKFVETFVLGLKSKKIITEHFTLVPTYNYAIGFYNGERLCFL
jgi:hypothetical protein